MEIQIKKVENIKDINNFITFGNSLYENVVEFCKPIISKERRMLFKQICIMKKYKGILALIDNKVVGRLLYTIQYSTYRKELIGYYSYFDCIDDETVCSSLFEYMINDIKSEVKYIKGPINPFDQDYKRGVLINGFDKEQTIFGQYNMPYYQKLLESFGMKKAYDSSILEFDIEKLKEKIDNEYIRTLHDKYNLKINDINLKKLDSECKDICKIFAQETLSKEYMRNPSVKIVEEVISKLSKLINPGLVKIIREEDTDMPVAFMLALPDYYEALRKMDGKVSILKDMKYKKSIDRIRCAVMYVIPQYQGAGLIKYLLSSLVDEINKNNIKYLESGLIPEDNIRFLESLSRYGGDVIKEYRVFGKEI